MKPCHLLYALHACIVFKSITGQPNNDLQVVYEPFTKISPAEEVLKKYLSQATGKIDPRIILEQNQSSSEKSGIFEKLYAIITYPLKLFSYLLTQMKCLFSVVCLKPMSQDTKKNETIDENSFGNVLNKVSKQFHIIYPGTEWCGSGNIAETPDDLGRKRDLDSCCRSHDQCQIKVSVGKTNYGLKNNGIFTRLHCSCDEEFYHCLKDVNTTDSKLIGYTYFDVLKGQCFKEEYKATCVEKHRNGVIGRTCTTYTYDNTTNKSYQWFDNPIY